MATNKEINRYQTEYKKKNYYRCFLLLPKDKEEVLKGHAAKTGETINAFITRAIWEQMKRDEEKMGTGESAEE